MTLEQADDGRVANGLNSLGAVAGALCLASRQTGEHLKQKSGAEAADVSTVTVREHYRDLQGVYNVLLWRCQELHAEYRWWMQYRYSDASPSAISSSLDSRSGAVAVS